MEEHHGGERNTTTHERCLVLWKCSPQLLFTEKLSSLCEALDSFTLLGLLGLLRGLAAPTIKNFVPRDFPADSISDPAKEGTDACETTRTVWTSVCAGEFCREHVEMCVENSDQINFQNIHTKHLPNEKLTTPT